MSANDPKLDELLTIARDKGHTPGRAQMREAVEWLDKVSREQVAPLEALILRCDSAPHPQRLDWKAWSFPERALRLALRVAVKHGQDPQQLRPAVDAALGHGRIPLFRQALRIVGRFAWADLMARAIQDPRVLSESSLRSIALESAAKCAGQDSQIATWVARHAQPSSKATMMAQREQHRAGSDRSPWEISSRAKWLAGVVLRLRFKEGMHDWVIAEVKRSPDISLLHIARGSIWVSSSRDQPYALIVSWRCVLDHAFALPDMDLPRLVGHAKLRAQVAELFGARRVSFRVQTSAQGRSQSWDQGAQVMQVWAKLVNDPKESDVELGEQLVDRTHYAYLRPNLRHRDTRFSYRVAEIPAASHPTVAAGLVSAAKVSDRDRIWDPFVGSGLELIEAGRLANCELLLGTDLDADALDCAAQNARAAGVSLDLRHQDAGQVSLPPVTKVISNPPHGRRVAQNQDLKALYHRVLANAFRALVPGGEVHWLTVQPTWGMSFAQANGGHCEVHGRIDLGGIVVYYQRIITPVGRPSRFS